MGISPTRTTLWASALAAALLVLWRGSGDVFWHDFGIEAWPAFDALGRGDLHGFLTRSPVYAGSMTLRAPLAYVASALGGDDNWVFRAGAIPGVGVLAWLAVTLAREADARIGDRASWALVILLAAGNPIVLLAFEYGHPEDVLASAAAVAAVLCALAGRTLVAGVLLGVAIAAKQWALLAVLPALLAAPRRDLRMLMPAFAIPAVLIAPVWLADVHGFTTEAQRVAGTGHQFHPHTVWFPVAEPGRRLPTGEPGYVAPAWLSPLAKPLILAVGGALALAWGWLRRPHTPRSDVLLLFAVVLLLRCMLDPWNLSYYHVPFLLSLLAWEVQRGGRGMITLAATGLVYLSFEYYDARSGAGASLLYLAWTLPLLVALAMRLVRTPAAAVRAAPAALPAR